MGEFLGRKKNRVCNCAVRKHVLVDSCGVKYEDTYKEIGGNHKEANTDILVILEAKEKPLFYDPFEIFIDKFFKDYKYTMIYGVGCTDKEFDSKDIINTYKVCKKIHIKKLVEKFNPKVIITVGRGLYTITESKDLNVLNNPFYVPIKKYCKDYRDFYEDDVWIYSSEFNCKVFPIPPLNTWTTFSNYEKEFVKDQFDRAINQLVSRKIRIPKLKFTEVEDPNTFLLELTSSTVKDIALDTETTGLNHKKDKVFCITLAINEIEGFYLEYDKIDKEILNKFFEPDKNFIWQNFNFDGKMLLEDGVNAKCTFDTMLASHSLNENSPNGLKPLSWIYTHYGGYEDGLQEIIKKYKIKDYSKLPKNLLLEYACTDPIVTFKLWKYFVKRFGEEDNFIKHNFDNVVMPAVDMLIDVERTGIAVDEKYIETYLLGLKEKAKVIEDEIYLIAGKELNLNSNKQLSEIFYNLEGFEVLRDSKGEELKTKNGDLKLDAPTLEKYAESGVEFAKKLVDYGHITKEISQIGKKEKKKKRKSLLNIEKEEKDDKGLYGSIQDGRLYVGYKLAGTKTGRLAGGGGLESSVNPQNFQKEKNFRKIFIPTDGYVISAFDYDGMEVSIGSQISGPGPLEKLILNDMDMHSYTASKIVEKIDKKQIAEVLKTKINNKAKLREKYEKKDILKIVEDMKFDYNSIVKGKEEDVLYKEFRGISKICNFQLQYGATIYGISRGLGVSKEIAKVLIDSYFESFPEFKRYMDDCIYHAQEKGWVKNLLGRKRRLPKLSFTKVECIFKGLEDNGIVKKNLMELRNITNNHKNISYNMPVQGTSGQTTIIAMTNIRKRFLRNKMKSRILGNVHDEILFEIYIPEIEEAYKIIKYYMEKPYYENVGGNKVTLKVSDEMGVWGFGKPLDWYKENEEEWGKLVGDYND